MVRIAALLCVFSVGAALRRHSKSEGATGREGMLGSDTSSYAVNKEAPNIAVNKEAPQAAAATYSLQEEGKYCKNQNHAFYSLVHDLGACAEFVHQRIGCGVWWIYYPTGRCHCVPEYAGNCDFATSDSGANVYMFETTTEVAVNKEAPKIAVNKEAPQAEPAVGKEAPQVAVNKEAPNLAVNKEAPQAEPVFGKEAPQAALG